MPPDLPPLSKGRGTTAGGGGIQGEVVLPQGKSGGDKCDDNPTRLASQATRPCQGQAFVGDDTFVP